MFRHRITTILITIVSLFQAGASAQQPDIRQQAVDAMRRAADFYHNRVATHGGYVYHYSVDLQQRWGEGVASENQIWVQPPGTPTVGLALLAAYEATGDSFYLDAARTIPLWMTDKLSPQFGYL